MGFHNENGRAVNPHYPGEPLTELEKDAMDTTVTLWKQLSEIIGDGESRNNDVLEAVHYIHALQRMIMSQAAGRAYPEEYRLLGESPFGDPSGNKSENSERKA